MTLYWGMTGPFQAQEDRTILSRILTRSPISEEGWMALSIKTFRGPITRMTAQLGYLVGGRARHLRAVRAATFIVRTYRRHYLSLSPALGRGELREASLARAHEEAALRVARLCEENGASWIKAAQFFSCRPDVLPKEYILALQRLQNDVRPVPFELLRQTLVARWGDQWRSRFASFDEKPVATASIAQVHRARLINGEEVAVKIRLPEVVTHFRQDETTFRLVARMIAPLVRELDLMQVVDQLLAMTLSELDFGGEAENLRRFAALPHRNRIRVPKLYEEMSHSDVLVTGWVEGARLRDHLDANPGKAADLLGELFASYVQQVTLFGIYQADPHPGNFIVDADDNITILDFGALAVITPEERENYARLLFACVSGKTEGIGELFVKAGFTGGNEQTLQKLAEYILTDRLKRSGLSEGVIDLMEAFREQRIRMPDSWVAISRVLITVGGFLMTYDVPFSWDSASRV